MGALVLLLLAGCDQTATQSMLDGSQPDVLDEGGDASGGVDTTADRRAVLDRPDADAPVPPLPAVYAMENVPVRRIVASVDVNLATAVDGTVWAWGNNSDGLMQPAERWGDMPDVRVRPQRIDGVREIEGANLCFLAGPEGRRSIYCWGRSAATEFPPPAGQDSWAYWRVPRQMGTFTDVIGLVDDRFCVRADHTVWQYGVQDTDWVRSSSFAGEMVSAPTPAVSHLLDGVEAFPTEAEWFEPGRHRIAGIVQSAGSGSHMCMLLNTGRVMCWGDNAAGQCGNFDLGGLCGERGSGPGRCVRRPTEVPGIADVVQIAAGTLVTCAVRRDGSVWCWGANSALSSGLGGLGDGRAPEDESCGLYFGRTLHCRRQPTRVAGIDDAVQITVGQDHQCAVRRNNQAVCWGLNREGQLGDGTTTDRGVPTPVRWF